MFSGPYMIKSIQHDISKVNLTLDLKEQDNLFIVYQN
jgi:hypothetical protein